MDSDASPEFSGYLHAIARRKALLFGIAIPIAVLAVLLALFLPDLYTSSALVEIDEPTSTQSLAETSSGESYADQYVTNLKGIVLTDSNLTQDGQANTICIRISPTIRVPCSCACGATSASAS